MKRILIIGLSLLVSAPISCMMMQEQETEESSEVAEAVATGLKCIIAAPFKLAYAVAESSYELTKETYQWLTKPTPPKPPKKPNVPVRDVFAANKAQMDKLQAQACASGMLARAARERCPADNAGAELIRRCKIKRGMREIWKQKPISKRVGLRK